MQLKPLTHTRYLAALALLAICFSSGPALGEIYRWTDAEGNVQFGDKPKDPSEAAKAAPVELKENYQPPARSADELQALEQEQELQRQRNSQRRSWQQAERDEALEQSRVQQAERCAVYENDLKTLTAVGWKNGMRVITYIEGEDGKSISAARQREITADLKKKMAEEGCN